MTNSDPIPGGQLMLERTGRHFLMMTFVTTLPDGSRHRETRSAFVVDVLGVWLLMTAGHVLRGILEEYPRDGVNTSGFELQDRFAGGSFPGRAGVPFHLEPNYTMMIDEDEADLGLVVLDSLTVSQLRAGGVVAIEEGSWGTDALESFTHLLLTGVPTETVRHEHGQLLLRHTLIPLQLCAHPSRSERDHIGKFSARLIQDEDDLAQLHNIEGMSGGPIFGVKDVAGVAHYFIVGVQSAWYRLDRIVTFSPAEPVLRQLREQLIERAAKREDD